MAKECEPGAKILLARAAIGNKEVIEELEKREDLIVDDVAIYDTFYENQDLIDEKGQFERGKIDCAVFTSASTVKGFVAATEGLDYTKVLAACIGKQTQEEALRYGMNSGIFLPGLPRGRSCLPPPPGLKDTGSAPHTLCLPVLNCLQAPVPPVPLKPPALGTETGSFPHW